MANHRIDFLFSEKPMTNAILGTVQFNVFKNRSSEMGIFIPANNSFTSRPQRIKFHRFA